MSTSNLQLVKELIQQGQTQKAVDILVENQNSFPAPFRKQIAQLSNRFYTLERQRQSHKITFDAYQTYSVDLIEHILDTVEMLETKVPSKEVQILQPQRKRPNWMTIVSVIITLLSLAWFIKTIILSSDVIPQLDFFEVKGSPSSTPGSASTADNESIPIDNTTENDNPLPPTSIDIPSPPPKKATILPNMILVKGGTYHRDGEIFEIKDFYIAEHETTRGEWFSILNGTIAKPVLKIDDRLPVTGVKLHQIKNYINAINQKTGKKYRLPSELEWEYAAAGGIHQDHYKYAGSSNLDDIAWHLDNADKQLHPVKKKKSNILSIYDMSGNAKELVAGCWTAVVPASTTNLPANCSTGGITKGGSRYELAKHHEIKARSLCYPDQLNRFTGFRLALEAQ